MTSGPTGPAARSLARNLGVPLVALVCCGFGSQAPERPQEVEVPGLGIMLKAGWQLLFHDRCRFAVPVSWHPDPDELRRTPGPTKKNSQEIVEKQAL